MTDRLLIVGGSGLFGSALTRRWGQAGEDILTTRRAPSDTDPAALALDLARAPEAWPDLPRCRAAVLCAGVTSLDLCRRDPEGTRRVNVAHTLALAERLADQGCFVAFLSSDRVFDGSGPRVPAAAATCPRTEYGRQKADLEAGAARLGDRAGIIRITKVIYPDHPLLRGWLRSLAAGTSIQAYDDMVCAPITLAAAVQAVARVAQERRSGIWQLSAAADITYADLAREAARLLGCDAGLVHPTPASGAAVLEHRPAHTTLDAAPSRDALGFDIPEPGDTVRRIVRG